MEMMQKRCSRDLRVIERIQTVLKVHEQLRQYATAVQVSIENTVIVLRGELPSRDLKQALVPAVRQAGVLGQVSNCVQVYA
ncbi:MAG: hypothetical protein HKN47_04070 [Pirellulaceae bacterium]|nr:hypothetical protein [Pirellulaceae bacterium]